MDYIKNTLMPAPQYVWCCSCYRKSYKDTNFILSKTMCDCQHTYCSATMDGDTRKVCCGQGSFSVSWRWTIGFVLLYILFGLFNNVGVQMMGYNMQPYPEFLLYGTTLMYTMIFAFGALLSGQSFCVTREHHKIFAWLGLWTSINGVLAQFAIPFVAPELTIILVQVALPVTWISAWYMFRWRVMTLRVISGFTILSGLMVGIIPSLFYGSGAGSDIATSGTFWIILTLLSAIPTAFETTFQERALKELRVDPWVALTYYNFYSLVIYFLTIPLTMTQRFHVQGYDEPFTWSQMWNHQGDAIKCFLGDKSIYMCGDHATLWVMLFTLGYVGMFGIGSILLRVKDSALVANINALLTPLSAMIFWIRPIVGGDGQDPVWWIGVSVFIIFVSNVVFELCQTEGGDSLFERWIRGTWLDKTLIREKFYFTEISVNDDEETRSLFDRVRDQRNRGSYRV